MRQCCDDLNRAMEDGVIVRCPPGTIADGRILNDIFSDHYLRIHDSARGWCYYALIYCPFCGRVVCERPPGS